MFFITNSRQNKQKERKTGFSSSTRLSTIGHHRLHEAEEEAALERLSLFFFLSLSVGKKYTLQEGTFCAVYTHHSVQQQITLYNHRQHHHLPSKGREREIGDLSRARAQRARAAQARLGEIQNKKTSLFSCCSYSYLKLTHSIIR